jgi:tyrosyl-tRNA synthetase
MESWEGAKLNEAKEILAFELTKLVHGEEEAVKAREASHALFAGGGNSEHMPTVELTAEDFAEGDMDILALLVKTGLCESRGDARRNVQQGGVTVADEKVTDIAVKYTLDAFAGEGLVVKRGKKKFVKVIAK